MQNDAKTQVYAGFFVRLVAFLTDMIIVGAGLLVVKIPFWIISARSSNNILVRDFIFQYSVRDIVLYLLTVSYFVLFTYYTGSTLGKKLFALRVVSVENRKLTLWEVIYRETIGRFLASIILNIGYLMIIVQKDHRGLHDLLSDTCVIYYHEKKVYQHTTMNYRNMVPQRGYTVPPASASAPNDQPQSRMGAMTETAPNGQPQSGMEAMTETAPNGQPQSGMGAMPESAPNGQPQSGMGAMTETAPNGQPQEETYAPLEENKVSKEEFQPLPSENEMEKRSEETATSEENVTQKPVFSKNYFSDSDNE